MHAVKNVKHFPTQDIGAENENDGKNMYPGYTVYKNPTVKNITSDKNGDEPCYVRMSVDILNSQGHRSQTIRR